jgi:hypothetical protein
MALFSRRSKDVSEPGPEDAAASADADTAAAQAEPAAASAAEDAAAAASVSISMSSYGGLGSAPAAPAAPAAAAPPIRRGARPSDEVAPPVTETVPGLRDNVLVRDALARVADGVPSQALLDVARQMLQGHLFLRVKGDARALLAEGKDLPLAMVTAGERSFALAFSSGAGLQASLASDGDADTSAMAQPVLAVIRHVISGPYDGLIIDQSSAPARAVLPKALLEKLVETLDESLTIKTLLADERTPRTAAAVAEAIGRVPLWVAVGKLDDGRPGIAEGRSADGSRVLEVYSHPLEVAVMGRGDQAAPVTATQLAGALRSDSGLTGVVVDPAGPWIRLTLDDLAPIFAPAG